MKPNSNSEYTILLHRIKAFILFSKLVLIIGCLNTLYGFVIGDFFHGIGFLFLISQLYIAFEILRRITPEKFHHSPNLQRALPTYMNLFGIYFIVLLNIIQIPRTIYRVDTLGHAVGGMVAFILVNERKLIIILQAFSFCSYVFANIEDPYRWSWFEKMWRFPLPRGMIHQSSFIFGSFNFILVMVCGHFMYHIYLKSLGELVNSMREKDQLLIKVSHEIRTPLNGIVGCSHILKEELNKYKMRKAEKYINIVCDCAKDILYIVNSILDFSKLSGSTLDLHYSTFCLPKLIKDSIHMLASSRVTMSKNLKIHKPIIDDNVPHYVEGDEQRLKQIFVNLLSNAVKYTAKGSVKFQVSKIKPESPLNNDEVSLHFQVEDTGIGLRKEDQEKIFRPFVQAHNGNIGFPSTGLGLSICKCLVELMRGKIWVESNPDVKVGSTFHFTCVLKKSCKSKIEKPIVPQEEFSGKKYPMKILIVEDNKINQMVTKQLLLQLGYNNLYFANDGEEAISMVKQNKFDLVLMDIHMPIMDGLEATKRIKALNIHQPIVYALSACSMPNDLEKCLEVGMHGHLSKPVAMQDLIETLKQVWHSIKQADN